MGPWFHRASADGPEGAALLRARSGPYHWLAVAVFLGAFAWAYLAFAGKLISTTNLEPQRQDQKHNMRRALVARDLLEGSDNRGVMQRLTDWMPHATDGVVAPLWPWVAARLAAPEDSIDEASFATDTPQDLAFFQRGKWFNVRLTLGFLLLLGLWTARHFSVLGTANFLLLAGFGAFLPRAVYFQPEPLFFILFLLAWLCAIALLKRNAVWRHALFGLLCGLAYLSKTSIEPLILGWFGVSSWRFVRGCLHRGDPSAWSCRNHFIGVLAFLFAYLLVIGPTLGYNRERFGSAFHNFPRYWMWMDDFDTTGYKWMQQHPTAKELQAVPPEEIPNARNYFKAHPWPQWWHRLTDGTHAKLDQFLAPKPEFKKPRDGWKRILDLRGVYLGGLVVMLGLAAVYARTRGPAWFQTGPALHPEAGSAAIFVIGTFAAYCLAYGWYHPVGRGERFLLGLYAPLVLSLLWGAEYLQKWADRRGGDGRWFRLVYRGIHVLIFCSIVWRLTMLRHDWGNGVWFDPDVI
ncbi:MAG: hypothetical protein KA004_12735 [Verrucomicrobiales bacterium]|nr:hypothetical protein [Verrucomicrobiales bacterium]